MFDVANSCNFKFSKSDSEKELKVLLVSVTSTYTPFYTTLERAGRKLHQLFTYFVSFVVAREFLIASNTHIDEEFVW